MGAGKSSIEYCTYGTVGGKNLVGKSFSFGVFYANCTTEEDILSKNPGPYIYARALQIVYLKFFITYEIIQGQKE